MKRQNRVSIFESGTTSDLTHLVNDFFAKSNNVIEDIELSYSTIWHPDFGAKYSVVIHYTTTA